MHHKLKIAVRSQISPIIGENVISVNQNKDLLPNYSMMTSTIYQRISAY
jgi:hypothetical protein